MNYNVKMFKWCKENGAPFDIGEFIEHYDLLRSRDILDYLSSRDILDYLSSLSEEYDTRLREAGLSS